MADVTPYDALLVVSFGGPEHPDEVLPFLRNVTAGKDIPDERLILKLWCMLINMSILLF